MQATTGTKFGGHSKVFYTQLRAPLFLSTKADFKYFGERTAIVRYGNLYYIYKKKCKNVQIPVYSNLNQDMDIDKRMTKRKTSIKSLKNLRGINGKWREEE